MEPLEIEVKVKIDNINDIEDILKNKIRLYLKSGKI